MKEKTNLIEFPLERRGVEIDPVTGLLVSVQNDSLPTEFIVVDDFGRGHAIKFSFKEAELETKKLRLKGINTYIMEL